MTLRNGTAKIEPMQARPSTTDALARLPKEPIRYEQYDRMDFGDLKVELLDGGVVPMSSPRPYLRK